MTEEGNANQYFYGYKTIGIFQSNEEIEQYNAMAAAASVMRRRSIRQM